MPAPRLLRLVAPALAAALLAACGGGDDGGRAEPAAPAAQKPAVVWAVGDGATGSDEARALGERIAADRPARLLYLGDVYPDGRAEDFAERYEPVYGKVAAVTEPTPGNHEWATRAEGYEPYWERAKGRTPPGFYAFELAGWQMLSMNSEAPHGPDSDQVAFLREQVRRGGDCRLAFWHRPRFSAGNYGDEALAPLWDALRGHAVLVLNAHDHNTQRFAPRDGITQIVAGAGGANFYPVERQDPALAFSNDTEVAGLRLTLRPGRADYAVVTSDGRTLDRGRIGCRPLAPSP